MQCPVCEGTLQAGEKMCADCAKLTYFERMLVQRLSEIGSYLHDIEAKMRDENR